MNQVEHLEFYLHKSHGSGCAHCKAIMEAAESKLYRVENFLANERYFLDHGIALKERALSEEDRFAPHQATQTCTRCRRLVRTEYRERQEDWL